MARIMIAVAGCVMTVAMAAVAAWAGERLTVRRTVLLLVMALGIGVFCCRCGAQLATNDPAYAYKWWVSDNNNVLQYEMRLVNGSGVPAANNSTYLVINKNEGVVVSNVSFQVAWAALQQCAADFDQGNYTDGTTGAYGKPFGSIPGSDPSITGVTSVWGGGGVYSNGTYWEVITNPDGGSTPQIYGAGGVNPPTTFAQFGALVTSNEVIAPSGSGSLFTGNGSDNYDVGVDFLSSMLAMSGQSTLLFDIQPPAVPPSATQIGGLSSNVFAGAVSDASWVGQSWYQDPDYWWVTVVVELAVMCWMIRRLLNTDVKRGPR